MLKKIFTLFCFIFAAVLPCYSSDIEYVKDETGVIYFKIPLDKYQNKIIPFVSEELKTASEVFSENNFKLVVNGGYFDPKTGAPVSSVVINSTEVNNIYANPELVQSLEENGRFDDVLNRTELRIIKTKKGVKFDIKEHNAPLHKDEYIVHSLQAGPMLLPDLRLEEESFIKLDEKEKPVQLACDVLKRRERTIIGLKNNNFGTDYLYIIIFTSDCKKALNEVRDFCKTLGLDKAMAMDGGASTSLNYGDIEIYSANDSQRRVKSFLVIEN